MRVVGAVCLIAAAGGAPRANALDPFQCLPMGEMNAVLKAEGQRTVFIGDRIDGPTADRDEAGNVRSWVVTVTSNADGSRGYYLEGDRPRREVSTKVCVSGQLTGIELFDPRKRLFANPPLVAGDFTRYIFENARAGREPFLFASDITMLPPGRIPNSFVVLGNEREQSALVATWDRDSRMARRLATVERAEPTSVAYERVAAADTAEAVRSANVNAAFFKNAKPFSLSSFPDPSQSRPILLFGREDIPMWAVLVARTHCRDDRIRNETMTLAEGSWSSLVGPTATYCGQNLIYYMGVMPYAEFRERMESGAVRIAGLQVRDFDGDTVFRVSKSELASAFRELSRREVAATTPRTGPAFRYAPPSTAPIVAGGPSASDILAVHGRSYQKYFGGQLTTAPGEVAHASPFGGNSHYDQRYVGHAGCMKIAAGKFRCTYDFEKRQVADIDSQYGRFLLTFSTPNFTRNEYTFVLDRGTWASADLDAANRAYRDAQANNIERQSRELRDSFRRDQEYWEKENQKRREEGFCLVTGYC